MGYSIQYLSVGKKKYPTKSKKDWKLRQVAAVTGLVLLAAVMNIKTIREQLFRFLLPGDPVITQAGLAQLVEDVRQGEPVAVALTDFCVFIVENG